MSIGKRYERALLLATLGVLLLCVAAFVRGWLRSEMVRKIPWFPDGASRALMVSLTYWALFLALAWLGRGRLRALLALAYALACAAFAGVVPTLAALLVIAASHALGCAVLSRNGRERIDVVDVPSCIALGMGLFGVTLAVLAVWPIATPFSYFALFALPIAWQRSRPWAMLRQAFASPVRFELRELFLLGVLGNLVVLHTAMALTPEVGNDALSLHLLIAAHVRDFGFWHYDVNANLLAVLPTAVDMLYAAGYMFGGENAAKLVNLFAMLSLLALVYATVVARADRWCALLAACLAAASPLVMLETASLFVDNAWALLVVAGLVAMLQFAEGGGAHRLTCSGLLLGTAVAAKVMSFAAFPAAGLLLALAARDRGKAFPWRAFVGAVLIGLALALPPYLIAVWKTGNPVFPFLNALFKSPLYVYVDIVHPRDSADPMLLYRMTFYSDAYLEGLPGSAGFSFLLLLPPLVVAALAWGGRAGAAMLFATLSYALVVFVGAATNLRYAYACVFLLAITAGVTIARIPASPIRLPKLLAAGALASIALNVPFLASAYGPARVFELAPIVDADARSDYVTRWAWPRATAPLFNGLPDRGAVAFLSGPGYYAGFRRPVYGDHAYTPRFGGRTAALKTRGDIERTVAEFDLAYFVLEDGVLGKYRDLLETVAKPRHRIASMTIYEVDPRVRFPIELATGSMLEGAPGGWIEIGHVPLVDGVALVDQDVALYRSVPVKGAREYRMAVVARCHREATAAVRLQVIWHDLDQRTQVSQRPVPCSEQWREEAAVFFAPPEATTAVVFVIGHGAERVEVKEASFRSRLDGPPPLPVYVDRSRLR